MGVVRLVVGGKPFLMVGGELHNSSSSCLDYFARSLDAAASLGVNTILAPVSWQQFERREGEYDFSLTDGMLKELRCRNLKWIPLWFGSWKNGASSYAPGWVKRDVRRFPRVRNAEGEELETLDKSGSKLNGATFAGGIS